MLLLQLRASDWKRLPRLNHSGLLVPVLDKTKLAGLRKRVENLEIQAVRLSNNRFVDGSECLEKGW